MRTHRIAMGGYSLTVYEDGAGPPILFGHSLTFDSSMWAHQAAALAEHHRVLRVDLHGHGQSGHPDQDYTLEQMAGDVARVLDHLEVQQCGYVGHSMGGMIGMRFAMAHPERVNRLALLNTSAAEQEEPMRSLFHQVNEDSRGKPTNQTTVNFVLGLMFSESFQRAHTAVVAPFRQLLADPPEGDGTYFAAKAVIWRTNVLEGLTNIEAPTLVVTSDIDTSVPPAHSHDIAASIPGASLLELSGSGHLTPVECADAITDALAAHFCGEPS